MILRADGDRDHWYSRRAIAAGCAASPRGGPPTWGNAEAAKTSVSVFTCPSDGERVPGTDFGATSYVGNVGSGLINDGSLGVVNGRTPDGIFFLKSAIGFRDFKLAGKPNLKASKLEILALDGTSHDVKDALRDTGYAPNEGYWTAKFVPVTAGLYMVAHSYDQVVHYAPTRSIKSAKMFFVVSNRSDDVPIENPGFDRVLGHPLELVATENPVTPMAPGTEIELQLLYKGEPLPATRVSFVPRGHVLEKGFDENYETETDAEGRARFTPKTGNTYLVVAHHQEPTESGENYESTKYSASLTVFVLELCSCCR